MDKITLIRDEFEKGDSGQKVEGITIILDGKLKEVFDILKTENKKYGSSMDIVNDALIKGINDIRKHLK